MSSNGLRLRVEHRDGILVFSNLRAVRCEENGVPGCAVRVQYPYPELLYMVSQGKHRNCLHGSLIKPALNVNSFGINA